MRRRLVSHTLARRLAAEETEHGSKVIDLAAGVAALATSLSGNKSISCETISQQYTTGSRESWRVY